MIMNFGSMLSGVAALAMVLGCYTVSLKVSGERKAVDDLRASIARDVRGIRTLQAELRTRARMPELQRWNDEVLALSAPTAGQFVRDPVLLASFGDRPEPRSAPVAPDMSYALAQAPAAPPSPVVKASYTPAARASAPMPAVSASLSLDDAVTAAVSSASLERIALR